MVSKDKLKQYDIIVIKQNVLYPDYKRDNMPAPYISYGYKFNKTNTVNGDKWLLEKIGITYYDENGKNKIGSMSLTDYYKLKNYEMPTVGRELLYGFKEGDVMSMTRMQRILNVIDDFAGYRKYSGSFDESLQSVWLRNEYGREVTRIQPQMIATYNYETGYASNSYKGRKTAVRKSVTKTVARKPVHKTVARKPVRKTKRA